MSFIFDLSIFIVFGHRQGIIDHFEVSLRIGIDLYELLSSKVIEFSLRTDRSLYFPWFGSRILNNYLLGRFSSHHAIKFKLLNGLLWLRNAFAYEIYI